MSDLKQINLEDFDLDAKFVDNEEAVDVNGGGSYSCTISWTEWCDITFR